MDSPESRTSLKRPGVSPTGSRSFNPQSSPFRSGAPPPVRLTGGWHPPTPTATFAPMLASGDRGGGRVRFTDVVALQVLPMFDHASQQALQTRPYNPRVMVGAGLRRRRVSTAHPAPICPDLLVHNADPPSPTATLAPHARARRPGWRAGPFYRCRRLADIAGGRPCILAILADPPLHRARPGRGGWHPPTPLSPKPPSPPITPFAFFAGFRALSRSRLLPRLPRRPPGLPSANTNI